MGRGGAGSTHSVALLGSNCFCHSQMAPWVGFQRREGQCGEGGDSCHTLTSVGSRPLRLVSASFYFWRPRCVSGLGEQQQQQPSVRMERNPTHTHTKLAEPRMQPHVFAVCTAAIRMNTSEKKKSVYSKLALNFFTFSFLTRFLASTNKRTGIWF